MADKEYFENLSQFIRSEKYRQKHAEDTIFGQIKAYEGDGLYKESDKTNEIIWEGTHFTINNKDKTWEDTLFKKGLCLFGMVKKDALNFVKANHGEVPLIDHYPTSDLNKKFAHIDKDITAVDIQGAFWYLAYNIGVITEKTFKKGIEEITVTFEGKQYVSDLKTVRNIALSTLGRPKNYFKIVGGVKTRDEVVIGGNQLLMDAYKLIRYTCAYHMNELRTILGDQYASHKTDAVYFVNTKENVKKVTKYLDSVNLKWRVMVTKSDEQLAAEALEKEERKARKKNKGQRVAEQMGLGR